MKDVNEAPEGVKRQPSDWEAAVPKTLQVPVFLPGAAIPNGTASLLWIPITPLPEFQFVQTVRFFTKISIMLVPSYKTSWLCCNPCAVPQENNGMFLTLIINFLHGAKPSTIYLISTGVAAGVATAGLVSCIGKKILFLKAVIPCASAGIWAVKAQGLVEPTQLGFVALKVK